MSQITDQPVYNRPSWGMPLLHDGDDRCVLAAGAYTLGGNGAEAVPIPRLETYPPVATIVVSAEEPPTIQRLTARVVVRIDQVPLGIAPKALHDGATIEFGDCRLTFNTSDGGAPAFMPRAARAPASDEAVSGARIVNVRTGESVEVGQERIVVGRDESCAMVVRSMHASRRHFSVAPVQGGYMLRDESANGTMVNGSRVVGTYLLGHGDTVKIEDEELRFEVAGVAAPQTTSDAGPTELLDVSSVRAEYAAGERRQASPPGASLEIVRGRFTGASFPIERAVCSLGRCAQSDVRIRDESVSNNHATLLRKGTSWFVVDLRSANGTYVNGSRVAGERELLNGARLTLGAVDLVFRSLDGGDAPVEKKRKGSLIRRLSRFVRS